MCIYIYIYIYIYVYIYDKTIMQVSFDDFVVMMGPAYYARKNGANLGDVEMTYPRAHLRLIDFCITLR